MIAPQRFAIPKNCLSCTLRRTSDFCDLPESVMAQFNAMGHLTIYPANATLLLEGQMPRGVYIACSGRAKLSVQSRDGKTIILRIAGDRQVLGLSAVVLGGPSPITVTTIELCQVKFIERQLSTTDREKQSGGHRLRHDARPRHRDFI
jgi:CRP/FNR family transcriptional regulator